MKRPPQKPYPFVGAVWQQEGGPRMRITHVADNIVWQDAQPTRGSFPVQLVDWQDWAMKAKCVEPSTVPSPDLSVNWPEEKGRPTPAGPDEREKNV